MMKKSLFALLMLLNVSSPAVVDASFDVTPEVTATEATPKPSKTAELLLKYRTHARCIALFAANNLLNAEFAPKKFFGLKGYKPADYGMHVATYLLDSQLPNTSESTKSKAAEWLAEEIVFSDVRANPKKEILKLALKAASRKQCFLPKMSNTSDVMRGTLGTILMPAAEALAEDIPSLKAAANNARFAFIGMLAGAVAEEVLMGIATDEKCPAKLVSFLSSDNNKDLVKNILKQFIGDSLNKAIHTKCPATIPGN